jgi:hypothetical protein
VVEGGISYELARDDRGPLGVATQAGKDFMHTAPFGCTAHLACLNVHMARVCTLQALVGSKLTVGHGDVCCARVDRRIPAQAKIAMPSWLP